MGQVLHGSATTTEAVRAIQHSQESLRGVHQHDSPLTTPAMHDHAGLDH